MIFLKITITQLWLLISSKSDHLLKFNLLRLVFFEHHPQMLKFKRIIKIRHHDLFLKERDLIFTKSVNKSDHCLNK